MLKGMEEEPYIKAATGEDLDRLATDYDFLLNQKVCECGKEKHGFAKHSDWCDIKDEE